tara:strand:- start:28520 stop:28741 length:222 start_codon:yes stop_codon:yes gene_type:complete
MEFKPRKDNMSCTKEIIEARHLKSGDCFTHDGEVFWFISAQGHNDVWVEDYEGDRVFLFLPNTEKVEVERIQR